MWLFNRLNNWIIWYTFYNNKLLLVYVIINIVSFSKKRQYNSHSRTSLHRFHVFCWALHINRPVTRYFCYLYHDKVIIARHPEEKADFLAILHYCIVAIISIISTLLSDYCAAQGWCCNYRNLFMTRRLSTPCSDFSG